MSDYKETTDSLRLTLSALHEKLAEATDIASTVGAQSPGGFTPETSTDPQIQALLSFGAQANAVVRDTRLVVAKVRALIRNRSIDDKVMTGSLTLLANYRYQFRPSGISLQAPQQTINSGFTAEMPVMANEGDIVTFVLGELRYSGVSFDIDVNGETIQRNASASFGFVRFDGKWELIENTHDPLERPEIIVNDKGFAVVNDKTMEQFLTLRPGEVAEWPLQWDDRFSIDTAIVSKYPKSAISGSGLHLPSYSRVALQPSLQVEERFHVERVKAAAFRPNIFESDGNNADDSHFLAVSKRSFLGTNEVVVFTVSNTGDINPISVLPQLTDYPNSTMFDVEVFNGHIYVLADGYNGSSKVPAVLQREILALAAGQPEDRAVKQYGLSSRTAIEISNPVRASAGLIKMATDGDINGLNAALFIAPTPSRINSAPNGSEVIAIVNDSTSQQDWQSPPGSYDVNDIETFNIGTDLYAVMTQVNSRDVIIVRARRTNSSATFNDVTLATVSVDVAMGGGIKSPRIILRDGSIYLITVGGTDGLLTSINRLVPVTGSALFNVDPVTLTGAPINEAGDITITHFNSGGFDYLVYDRKSDGNLVIKRIDFYGDEVRISTGQNVSMTYASAIVPIKVGVETLLFVGHDDGGPNLGYPDTRSNQSSIVSLFEAEESRDVMVSGSVNT